MNLPNPGVQLGNACCKWRDFFDGFEGRYIEWMGVPPTDDAWKAAIKDWKACNTGWEAAHNARRRAREAVERANAKPLVHLGGRNYAEAGSDLAIRFGKTTEQKGQP
jgi:hypothetical protein